MNIKFNIPRDPMIMGAVSKWLLEEAQAITASYPDGSTASGRRIPDAVVEKTPDAVVVGTAMHTAAELMLQETTRAAAEEEETPEFDKDGLPWDARIHSASATILKKEGTWKLKRGVDEALVATVQAEHTNAQAAVTTPPAADNPFVEPPVPTADVTAAPAPTANAFGVVSPPPATPPAAAEMTYIELAQHLTPLSAADLVNPEMLTALVTPYGAKTFPDLAEDKFRPFYGTIATQLKGMLPK